MTATMIIGWIVMIVAGIHGWQRGSRKLEEKIQAEKERSKRRRKRVNVSDDAPEELSQAELEAMGKWFQD
jgi:hypothetical protein